MNNSLYKKLSFVSFSKIFNWSVQYANIEQIEFSKKYKTEKIGSFLRRIKDSIEIDDNTKYKRVSIKLYNGGITLRDIEIGSNIGTKKQFLIKSGQFLLSKIDARNGAFGVVPDECNNAIITGNFWTFDVDETKINPHFLTLIMTTKQFIQLSEKASNGTTNRHYLQENLFLDMEIPLPGLKEQQKIVDRYNTKLNLAEKQEKEIGNTKKHIEQILFEKLGINYNPTEGIRKSLVFTNFKNLNRWDYEYNKFFSNKIIDFGNKYQTVKFGNCVISYQYGTSSKANLTSNGVPVLRMNNIVDGTLDTSDLKFINSLKETEINKLKLTKEDLLFNRTNSKELVGKMCIFDKNEDYIFASYLIKVKVDKTKVNPYFINYLFNSPILRAQIDATSRQVTGQANINTEELGDFLIPLPPLNIQNEIVQEITNLRTEIKKLYDLSLGNRQSAQQEFEKELFE